jgi:hypothetical protein
MAKVSSSKKVARVARTGGGRTRKGQTSLFWPIFIGVVVVLGTIGVLYSKSERQPDNSRPLAGGAGRAGDHWHAALGFDVCGSFLPNIADEKDVSGIHTHGDGVVHIHPFSSLAAGKRATLNVFFKTVSAKVTSTEIRLPGQPAKSNGDKCGDKPGVVQVKTWPSRAPDTAGTLYTGNPSDLRPKDGELITIAFQPKGDDIPRPPSAGQLDKLSDVGPASSTTVPNPQGSTPTSAPGDTSNTAPGSTTPGSSTPPPSAAQTPTSKAP